MSAASITGRGWQESRDIRGEGKREIDRADFTTFEDYCRERWGWEKRHAYRLIEAAEVVNALPENVRNCAQTESQARALAKAPEGQRAEVLQKAVEFHVHSEQATTKGKSQI